VAKNLNQFLQVLSSLTIKLQNVNVSVQFHKFLVPNSVAFNVKACDLSMLSAECSEFNKCPLNPNHPSVSDMLSVLYG
jgi:hypothetical protein